MEKQKHPLDVKAKGARGTRQRKLSKDGRTWTPAEKHNRNRMLKQFCKSGRKGVDVTSGNSDAYRSGWDSIDWGRCKCAQAEPGVICGHCRNGGKTP